MLATIQTIATISWISCFAMALLYILVKEGDFGAREARIALLYMFFGWGIVVWMPCYWLYLLIKRAELRELFSIKSGEIEEQVGSVSIVEQKQPKIKR